MNTYRSVFEKGRKRLLEAEIAEAEYDAKQLFFYVFDLDMQSYYLNQNREVKEEKAEVSRNIGKYFSCIERRAKNTPLQYIIGKQNFCGLDIFVNEDVLIPRFDTEILVEKILKDHADNTKKRILDLCTGSGAIAISLKKLGKFSSVHASDISKKALKLAKKSAAYNNVEIEWIESDLFKSKQIPEDIDIIVSNPPYIRSKEIKNLMPEVRLYEPVQALDGGEDGLSFYRIIIKEARNRLKPGGMLYLEIGYDQGKEVCKLLEDFAYRGIELQKDLAGKDRICSACYG